MGEWEASGGEVPVEIKYIETVTVRIQDGILWMGGEMCP
jgi:hypothetical protein